MRIAARTMLCATGLRGQAVEESGARFAELRELCNAAGDKLSLAIGMTGLLTAGLFAGRMREASRLASEQTALLESIGDPAPTVGLSFPVFCTWFAAGEVGETLRWSQTAIDLADGDPAKGAEFGVGLPLAVAIAFRGAARWWLGRTGWRQDIHDALAMARHSDPTTRTGIVAWTYGFAIQYGVLVADDSVVRSCEEVLQAAAAAGNDMALGLANYTLAVALLNRDAAADRHRGVELMSLAHDLWLRDRALFLLPVTDVWSGRERARRGDRDVIAVMRQAVDELLKAEQILYGAWGAGVLVETLLERGTEADVREAAETIDRLANWWPDSAAPGSPVREIVLLRLRTLLARAGGDDVAYRELVERYREMAKSLDFEGHTAWAEAQRRHLNRLYHGDTSTA
jgi:hypothetical protein